MANVRRTERYMRNETNIYIYAHVRMLKLHDSQIYAQCVLTHVTAEIATIEYGT